jgi:subtilisin-like proprotein convertase family protein
MAHRDPIPCRFDEDHLNPLPFSVFCSSCQRPLFNSKWWYHAVLLNLAILLIGFILGEYNNLWIPSLIVGFSFTIYLLLLFRRIPFALFMSILLFSLTFPVIFVSVENIEMDFINDYNLTSFKNVWIYVTCLALFIVYTLAWFIETDGRDLGYIKNFPVLSSGWFLILLCIYAADIKLHFLNARLASVINNQIYLREALLALTGSYLLILALIKSSQNKVEVTRNYLNPKTEIEYWTTVSEEANPFTRFFLNAYRPVYNLAQTAYKAITEGMKLAANFIIYLGRLCFERVIDYAHELFKTLKATAKSFLEILWKFLRLVLIPLLLFYGISILLISFIETTSLHISSSLLIDGYLEAGLLLLTLNGLIVISTWLLSTRYSFGETLQNISVTNLLFTLIITLYACVASFELFAIAHLRSRSPFATIGPFTVFVLAALLIGLAFIYARLNPRRTWMGIIFGALVLTLAFTWWKSNRADPGQLFTREREASNLQLLEFGPIPSLTPVIIPPPKGTSVRSFNNTTSIVIPDSGVATPYPSAINVTGVNGVVSSVIVTLTGINHSYKGELDIALVGPAGNGVILMSDITAGPSFNNTTIRFADDPRNIISQNSNTILRPENEDSNDSYPTLPAASSFNTRLSVFNGANPNGIWRLYIIDDTGSDGGGVSGGWSLTFLVDPSVVQDSPPVP